MQHSPTGHDGGLEQTVPVVRVFLSSPGDVNAERNVALGVIRRLQTWFQGRLVLVPVLWEQEPLLATAGFQHEIDRRAPPSATDVAIFILWARLGTPLSRDFELEDGRRPTGTEWEFTDAARAHREHQLPHILVYRRSGEPLLKVTADDYERRRAEFAAVQAFFEHHFRDAVDLSFKGSFHGFEDASAFGQLLESHLLKLLNDQLAGKVASDVTWPGSPFRGLETFEAEHAPIFFGRTRALQDVRLALARQVQSGCSFVLILGPSGTGKSSLARAGLLPFLSSPWVVEDSLSGGTCVHVCMNPGHGATPIQALCAALLAEGVLPELAAHGDEAELATAFAESPRAAVSLVRGALRQGAQRVAIEAGGQEPAPVRLVLLVDQLEEVFTGEKTTDADRQDFASVIDALARSGEVWVLATLRSDFYPALSRIDTFMALKDGNGHYDLARPNAAEIAQVIRGPAYVAGLTYETDTEGGRALDDVLIAEASEGADALPLLEYALLLLEDQKQGTVMTFEAYEAMGGIEGAIGSRAEEVWTELPEEACAAFPALLRSLVEVGPRATVTRRRAPLEEVLRAPGAGPLVDRFVEARLLVAAGDGSEATVSVAHEALLRTWPRAAEQISAEADLLRVRSRMRAQAARWLAQERDASLLLAPGKPLEEALLVRAAGFDLTELESDYVAASRVRARRRKNTRRAAVAAIAILAVVAAAFAVFARAEQREAERARLRAEAAQAHTQRALDRVRSLGLAAASRDALTQDPMLALLLAREGVRIQPTSHSVTALRTALVVSRERATLRGHEGPVYSAVVSPLGRLVLTASGDRTARVWDLRGRQVAVLEGHEGWVNSASFSPSADRILTASGDHTARLWDLAGSQQAVFRGHVDTVYSAVFSPNGEYILTAGDKTARLWNREGRAQAILRGHEDTVYGAVFSASGDYLLTASKDRTARVWDREGRELAVLRGHEDMVYSASFSPDEALIATASGDHTARLWNLKGDEIAVLRGHEHWVRTARFSPDGRHVLTASWDRTARIWSRSGEEVAVLIGHTDHVRSAIFSPDGESILTASWDRTARLWDRRGAELAVLRGPQDTVYSAAFSPDGRLVAAASKDGTALLWDREGREVAVLRGHRDTVYTAAFSPDGGRVLTASGGPYTSHPHSARLWDLEGREIGALHGHQSGLCSVAFDPHSDLMLTAGGKTARLWRGDGETAPVLRGHENDVNWAGFSPEGDRILTASSDRSARLWDRAGRLVARLLGHESVVLHGAFSPDGQRIVTASRDGTSRLWDREGREVATLRGHEDTVYRVVFSPDGDLILTASEDRTARIWDLDGTEVAVLRGHGEGVNSATFSPSGDRVLTASSDGTARLWDPKGREVGVLRGHEGWVNTAVYSPNGHLILTASDDGTARIWDVQGQEVAVLHGHEDAVCAAIFSPAGDLVVTASRDQTARIWYVDPEDLIRLSNARITRDLTQRERVRFAGLLEGPRPAPPTR